MNKNGVLHTEPGSKANILNDQFASVFTKEKEGNISKKGTVIFQYQRYQSMKTGFANYYKTSIPIRQLGQIKSQGSF